MRTSSNQWGISRAALERSHAAGPTFDGVECVLLRMRFPDARDEANAFDALLNAGIAVPLAGLTLAAKACFDVGGWVTDAASAVLANEPPAAADAPLVGALRRAGATLVGHANMTKFAFGALGINTTTGTPLTPLPTWHERIAGGSTSGGAVAVACGLADIALGTDASGSVRIPAAFCGLVGFKPSKGVLSERGCIPLSTTFDTPGFITRDATTMLQVVKALSLYREWVFGCLSPGDLDSPRTERLRCIRFAIPRDFALQRSDGTVVRAFERTVVKLRQCGATIVVQAFTDQTAPSRIASESGIIADAYTFHEKWIQERLSQYDLLVGPRILIGQTVSAFRYIRGKAALQQVARKFDEEAIDYDALLTPTVPIIPPRVRELEARDEYLRVNSLVFSLTELANRVDVPSISLPFGTGDAGPYGLMLTGCRRDDARLLSIGRRVEQALA